MKNERLRLQPEARKKTILEAALRVAGKPGGWSNFTRIDVAREANCAEGLVSFYFGTMTKFKRAVMRAAIAENNLKVIAQGIVTGDSTAKKASDEQKAQALAQLTA